MYDILEFKLSYTNSFTYIVNRFDLFPYAFEKHDQNVEKTFNF